jgi:hypothetical protein
MLFGIGREKEQDAQPAATLSPEAAALLHQMTPQNNGGDDGDMAGRAPNAPSNAVKTMPAPPSAPRMPDPDDYADGNGDDIGEDKLRFGRKARAKQRRAEKHQSALSSKTEKARLSHRRRLSKTRFSRTKYLREAHGNAMTSLIAIGSLFLIATLGPVVLNTQYLIPRTNINMQIIAEINALRATIASKASREAEISQRLDQFMDTPSARAALLGFIAALEQNGVTIENESSRNLATEELGITGLAGQNVTLFLRSNFLNYLIIINKFVESQQSIQISEESITASRDNPVVDIRVSVSLPSRS